VLADPRIGGIDESALVRTVLHMLSKGQGRNRIMAEVWSQTGMLTVKRARPVATAGGKNSPPS
jgi:hypothetical protein